MANSLVDGCYKRGLAKASDDDLPKKRHRAKFLGYHYVPSESDEADTLKDKFWRDLEQGKLNFLNTVDMYTRVKRPGKLSDNDCSSIFNQDTALLSETGSDINATSLRTSTGMPSCSTMSATEESPTSSSGYESGSISSIGSLSVNDSPTECEPYTTSLPELLSNIAESTPPRLKRGRKVSQKVQFRRCRGTNSDSRALKTRNSSKYFTYVDAASEEADTLKDKFWRNLEMGNVSAVTTTDLYSSVKVARRARQLPLHSAISEAPVRDSAEELKDTERCLDSIFVETSDADGKDGVILPDLTTDCQLLEQLANITDDKLRSPCSVSVERLPSSVHDTETCEPIEHCSSVITESLRGTITATAAENLITDSPQNTSSKTDCRRCTHNRRRKTGLRYIRKYTAAEQVHLSGFEVNCNIPICRVLPAEFHSCERRVVCGWLEDESLASKRSLREAVINDDAESLRCLLAAAADGRLKMVAIDDCCAAYDKMNLLMLAARHGSDSVIRLLADVGCDVNSQRSDGITALMIACRMGFVSTVKALLEYGAYTELRTNCAETALLKAVRSGSADIVALLLYHGANFAVTSRAGLTAATMACRAQRWDIVHIISTHVHRVLRAFIEQVHNIIGWFSDMHSPLFPVQCFPLSNSTQFAISFSAHRKLPLPELRPLLFIGHSLTGCHGATSRLDGSSAVRAAYLNNVKLRRLSADDNFIMSFEHLRSGSNKLVLHLEHDPASKRREEDIRACHLACLNRCCGDRYEPPLVKRVKLVVCAYYVKCKREHLSKTCIQKDEIC